jgi:hypothetical protein
LVSQKVFQKPFQTEAQRDIDEKEIISDCDKEERENNSRTVSMSTKTRN